MSVYARQETMQLAELSWPSPPDPGDLSKRIARRRAELRLSTAQVAARARISRRYLEYLERYPSSPSPAVLRLLAAALRTTPAALLGAGADTPPGLGARPEPAVTLKLTPAECRRLIAPGGIGRVAFTTASGPVILPVNYTVVGPSIVIRTDPGTLIETHGDERAAFEVDHIDEVLRQGWSVLVRGQAHRVLQPGELRHVRTEATVQPWAGGPRDIYVRIVPDRITGRRIAAH
jgi:nitroimidazol reductase NimA-like FMN-containing flavoprotein (pyridoxamine 5'-phosphate oxidase superfamily)/DNA-binding transcriptional regulator YiaG